LSVFWETEPGTEIRPQSELPDPAEGLDAPEVFAGFLDAVRWGDIASADPQGALRPRLAADKAMRRLAPHLEHRLFLTPTPHNGYPESFPAMLGMLDPNRFTKGRGAQAAIPRSGDCGPVEVVSSDDAARRPSRWSSRPRSRSCRPPERLLGPADGLGATPAEKAVSPFIALLLKKRLLSSPTAFKHTLDQHIRTVNPASRCRVGETVMREAAAPWRTAPTTPR